MTPLPPSVLYRIDVEAGVVYLASGLAPDFPLWRSVLEGLLADPDYRPGMSLLSDRRDVRTFSMAYADGIVSFLRNEGRRLGRCRWAVVASSPAAYGVTRAIEARTDGLDVRVRAFYRLEEAEAWVRGGPERE